MLSGDYSAFVARKLCAKGHGTGGGKLYALGVAS